MDRPSVKRDKRTIALAIVVISLSSFLMAIDANLLIKGRPFPGWLAALHMILLITLAVRQWLLNKARSLG